MDFKAIATSLATTVGTVTVGGETATATARLPDSIGSLALLVYPPEVDLAFVMGPMVNAHILFPVRLLRDPLTMPERTDALLDWATALWPKPQSNYDLNIAGVLEAQARTIRIAIDGQNYSDVTGVYRAYDVVEMNVDVHVYELATFVP